MLYQHVVLYIYGGDVVDLREFREKHNLTQAEVSRSLGISLNTYIRWETKVGNPGYENKIKLVEYMRLKGEIYE